MPPINGQPNRNSFEWVWQEADRRRTNSLQSLRQPGRIAVPVRGRVREFWPDRAGQIAARQKSNREGTSRGVSFSHLDYLEFIAMDRRYAQFGDFILEFFHQG